MKIELSKKQEPSLTQVKIFNVNMIFSYDTLMYVDRIFNKEKYSKTTTKHMNSMFGKDIIKNHEQKTEEELLELVEEKIKKNVLDSISDEELFQIALDRRLKKAEIETKKIKI